jgi:LmbE family N-acetylglucosaminyl deacetylase
MSSAEEAILLLLAHHDDEVWCAGRIRHAQRLGKRVRLLWATAGGFAPAARRQREGLAVASLLCLRPEEHLSLGLPDQHAVDHLDEIAAALSAMLANVAEVLVPAYEGGHPDHDAVNMVAARVCAGRAAVSEFSLYRRSARGVAVKPLFPGEPGPPERFELDAGALRLRRQLIWANASQWPELATLAALATTQRTWRLEPCRRLPAHDYMALPLGMRPLYEVYTRRRFGQFRAAAQAFLPAGGG